MFLFFELNSISQNKKKLRRKKLISSKGRGRYICVGISIYLSIYQ